jgi:ABC-2 type transporter
MRWYVLRTLLKKEVRRHLANKGGLVLIALLIVAGLLLSITGKRTTRPGQTGFSPGVLTLYLDYEQDSPLVHHLSANVPDELAPYVTTRPFAQVPRNESGLMMYAANSGAIQLRQGRVWFWYPGEDRAVIAPFEMWFWKESARFADIQRSAALSPGLTPPPPPEATYTSLHGGLDARSGLATSLVLFGLFFVCVYLLPSLTCEERERGVLLAQALSPASAVELLAARFLFYPVVGVTLAAVLAGTYAPAVLLRPFFWLSLLVCVAGSMGVGLTIASIARTQRGASMGAMAYLLAVSLLLFICQQNNIMGLPWLAIEYHGPRVIHAALTNTVHWYHWVNLAGAATLAVCWTCAAVVLFRRRGWQ